MVQLDAKVRMMNKINDLNKQIIKLKMNEKIKRLLQNAQWE